MLKKISTLSGAHILSKNEQKSIRGGGDCPGVVCRPLHQCCAATNFKCEPTTGAPCP